MLYIIIGVLLIITNIIMFNLGKRYGRNRTLDQIILSFDFNALKQGDLPTVIQKMVHTIFVLADPGEKSTPPHDENLAEK